MTKENMIDILKEKNRVSCTTTINKMTKREIAEKMNCHITDKNFISTSAFKSALLNMLEYNDQI